MSEHILVPVKSSKYDTRRGFTLKSSTFEDGTQVNQCVDENGGDNPIVTGPDQEWIPTPDIGRYPLSDRIAVFGLIYYGK